MKGYKKIAIVCAAFAGFLLTGYLNKGDVGLRHDTLKKLRKMSGESYAVSIKSSTITASGRWYMGFNQLEVRVKNNEAGNESVMTYKESTSPLWRYYSPWHTYKMEKVTYSGLPSGTENADKIFDEALRILKPELEQKIKQDYPEVKEKKYKPIQLDGF